MDAVKRGADRQELHERIRIHSMEASKNIKEEGNKNDLLERIASDPVFNLTIEQLNNLLTPQNYIGMAKEQTEEFLSSNIRPILEENSNSNHLNLNVFV